MAHDLSGYEEVPDRIVRFFSDHPEGSLRCEKLEYKELPAAHKNGEPCLHIIYHALAFRGPDDKKPGQGKASEPIPGLTQFTKGSELMNAETSAWGRALAAIGYVGKKIASADEVRARQDQDAEGSTSRRTSGGAPKPSPAQLKFLHGLIGQKQPTVPQLKSMLADVGAPGVEIEEGWANRLTGGKDGQVSQLIERLKAGELPVVASVERGPELSEDAPVHPPATGEDVPWESAA
jgi:hypothetical protein